MTLPELYTRTFTQDELEKLATAVGFARRMLASAEYPQSTLDDLTLLLRRLDGVEFSFAELSV